MNKVYRSLFKHFPVKYLIQISLYSVFELPIAKAIIYFPKSKFLEDYETSALSHAISSLQTGRFQDFKNNLFDSWSCRKLWFSPVYWAPYSPEDYWNWVMTEFLLLKYNTSIIDSLPFNLPIVRLLRFWHLKIYFTFQDWNPYLRKKKKKLISWGVFKVINTNFLFFESHLAHSRKAA